MSTSNSPLSSKQTHIQSLEKKISDLKTVHAQLPGRQFYDDLLTVIHKPGWTTVAESMLVQASLDSIQAHTDLLITAHRHLMDAAKLVGEQ